MANFIEITLVDESGGGNLFPTLIDKNEIISVMDISQVSNAIDMPDANCVLLVRGVDKPAYTTATYADLRSSLTPSVGE